MKGGKSMGNISLGRPSGKWVDIIRMDHKYNTRNWVNSVQDMDYWRLLVNAALNRRVSWGVELVSYATERYLYNQNFIHFQVQK